MPADCRAQEFVVVTALMLSCEIRLRQGLSVTVRVAGVSKQTGETIWPMLIIICYHQHSPLSYWSLSLGVSLIVFNYRHCHCHGAFNFLLPQVLLSMLWAHFFYSMTHIVGLETHNAHTHIYIYTIMYNHMKFPLILPAALFLSPKVVITVRVTIISICMTSGECTHFISLWQRIGQTIYFLHVSNFYHYCGCWCALPAGIRRRIFVQSSFEHCVIVACSSRFFSLLAFHNWPFFVIEMIYGMCPSIWSLKISHRLVWTLPSKGYFSDFVLEITIVAYGKGITFAGEGLVCPLFGGYYVPVITVIGGRITIFGHPLLLEIRPNRSAPHDLKYLGPLYLQGSLKANKKYGHCNKDPTWSLYRVRLV